ncbi:MAG: cytidine deaminase family protein [Thermoplasmata archaeon]
MVSDEELIEKAASVINPKKIGDSFMGDVGSALITEEDNIYTGVCIDTPCGMGYCAEHNAVGSMVTEGEYKIEKIVAVWKDEEGSIQVIPPCGRCREFMRQINEENLETEVIVGEEKKLKLKNLLPYHDWFADVSE